MKKMKIDWEKIKEVRKRLKQRQTLRAIKKMENKARKLMEIRQRKVKFDYEGNLIPQIVKYKTK